MSPIGKLFKEALRRKVVRVVGAYLAIFWAVTLGIASLVPALGLPEIVTRIWIIAGLGAIPVIAFVSWRYDIVPPQLVRDVQDVALENPGLSWARVRHDNKDAGYVLLTWTHDGNRLEKRFFQPISVGREATNDVELGDERVSRHHAVLWAEDGIWHIRDLDSANGTFIGHSRVSGSAPLPQSCDLRFHVNGPIVSVHVAKSAATRVG